MNRAFFSRFDLTLAFANEMEVVISRAGALVNVLNEGSESFQTSQDSSDLHLSSWTCGQITISPFWVDMTDAVWPLVLRSDAVHAVAWSSRNAQLYFVLFEYWISPRVGFETRFGDKFAVPSRQAQLDASLAGQPSCSRHFGAQGHSFCHPCQFGWHCFSVESIIDGSVWAFPPHPRFVFFIWHINQYNNMNDSDSLISSSRNLWNVWFWYRV